MDTNITPFVRQRHRRHANPFAVRGAVERVDWADVYRREAPFALDIGCGPGRFVCDLAGAHPEWNVLGLEIRQHLVEETRYTAAAMGLAHAWAMVANANVHLADLLPPRSVAFVSVNFPDPWYKKRHRKRRVVNAAWVDQLCGKLLPGAEFHAMTDFQPVAEEIREVMESHPRFTCAVGGTGFSPGSTTGLTSEREIKHMQRGEPIFRLRYVYDLGKLARIE